MGNTGHIRFWPPREPLLLTILLFLGVVSNYLSFPLFFGVDFLFGSIFSLIVLSIYGLAWGALASIIISGYTYFLWGHPYAVIIFSLEIIFVGICLIKPRFSMLQCVALFWIVLGAPSVFFFYHLVMEMDYTSTFLVMLKQCTNGVFNAIIATLLINFWPALRSRVHVGESKTVPIREILFNFMVVLVFFSVLAVMVIEGRIAKWRMESDVATNLRAVSSDLSGHLQLWFAQHMHGVTELASMAGQRSLEDWRTLQKLTEATSRMFPDFHNMYIADAGGTTVTFFPPVNEKGESTIGLNFSDRDYYKKLKTDRKPVLSKVFQGRGGVFSPIITLSAPVIVEGKFKGFALAALDLTKLRKILEAYSRQGHYKVTLIDVGNRIIASNVSERAPMADFNNRQVGEIEAIDASFFLWTPTGQDLPAMTRYKRSWYIYEEVISPDLPWKILIESPVAGQQMVLFRLYSRYLTTILICTAVTFLLASIISTGLASPLTHLAYWTERMPDPRRLSEPDTPVLPRSYIAEIDSLVRNFEATSHTLRSNFIELNSRSKETERINRALQTKIDELEMARQALKEAEHRYRTFFEQSPDAVVIIDPETTLPLEFNDNVLDLLGYTREEFSNLEIHRYYADENQKEVQQRIHKTLEQGREQHETNMRTKDGSIINVLVNMQVIELLSKQMLHVIFRDVTEKRNLEAQLLQSQKMEAVGVLAGGIAHDFNNLLQAILGYSQFLLLDRQENMPGYTELSEIVRASEKGAELVRQLLIFSRKARIRMRPLDLNQEIETLGRIWARTFPRMIEIEFHLDYTLKPINADQIQIEQVLMNLAVNARDVMPDGGNLAITTKNVELGVEYGHVNPEARPGNYVMLSMTDTGVGIDPESQEHIFEPFYTTKATGKGTGLGLAIVYGIVKSHGGFITCRSEAGEGTTFEIFLPALEDAVLPVPEERSLNLFHGSETILLIEDEVPIQDLGRRILERFGYTVLAAANGVEALDIFQRERSKIDLVILDLIMPEMDGITCFKHLRELEPDVKIVITSGYNPDQKTKDSLVKQADGFISKPFEMGQMLTVVQQVIDNDSPGDPDKNISKKINAPAGSTS